MLFVRYCSNTIADDTTYVHCVFLVRRLSSQFTVTNTNQFSVLVHRRENRTKSKLLKREATWNRHCGVNTVFWASCLPLAIHVGMYALFLQFCHRVEEVFDRRAKGSSHNFIAYYMYMYVYMYVHWVLLYMYMYMYMYIRAKSRWILKCFRGG